MRIGSIIDVSLVDVPGIPVTVIFTAGCNMDCPYCQNSELISLESGVEMPVKEIVEKASRNLTEGYCITGGEPTIHSDLPFLLELLKNDKAMHINLNTQGSVPNLLQQCLPHVNSVWFDMKAPPNRYQEITRSKSNPWPRIRQSIEMLLDSEVTFWPRTTYAGGLMTPLDIEMIIQTLAGLGYKGEYVVQNYVVSTGVRFEEMKFINKPNRKELKAIQEHTPSSITLKLDWR